MVNIEVSTAAERLPADVRKHYPFEGKRLTLKSGHHLHFVDEGKGDPLLFVHGNPTWSFYWRRLVQAFAGSYRCLAPDHLGCGLSDKPQDWSYRLADHVDNLVQLIEALDLRKITLVVHDWGGAIGFGAALKLPDRVSRVVIFNTGCFEGPIPWEIRSCRVPGIGALAIRGLNGFVRVGLFRAIADRRRFNDGVGHGYLAPYDSWEHRIANLRFVQDIPLEADHPTRAYFESIGEGVRSFADRPSMIVWGEQDFCFTPHYRKGFIERLPQSEVHVFDDASHWVVEDAHDRIVPLMQDFFARHPLPGAQA